MAFTWSNNREDGSWARLDRFLCSLMFLSWFPYIFQKGLSRGVSDHNPILLGQSVPDWGPKPFRIQNEWLDSKEFADDTLLFLEPCMEFLLNSKRVLRCFELVSGLKVNFHKSCIVKVGKKIPGDEGWAKAFHCVSSSLLISYLGLPLSGNAKREESFSENLCFSFSKRWSSLRAWEIGRFCYPVALAWTFCPNGSFSVKSFRRCLEEIGEVGSDAVSSLLWLGFVPHKVEVFLWQLLKVRILVKEVLHNFGMVQIASIECPLCNSEWETVNHLFLHCDWAWKLWSEAMGWWEVSSCKNKDISGWADGWSGLCNAKSSSRAWIVLFYAVCWTIWDIRNVVVFNGKEAIFSLALDSVRFRLAWWFKHFSSGSSEDVTILMLDVERRCVDRQPPMSKQIISWSPPLNHDLVFIVDGSAKGNSGLAGIGVVLRDANGKILCLLPSPVGLADSILAEVLAIHRACTLIYSSMFFKDRNITILSDSRSVVSWINGEGFGNIRIVKWLYDIRQFLLVSNLVVIKFTARSYNSLADSLAKNGSILHEERLEWGL
ncbi:hypothetical protein Dsin_033156 [Dipteronia sinensis]|uniref:RNase H type-1 domain-containing protein n=1 Tax=Dipteronia sinensis TaxID=43782 RepID=A0AAD9Z5V0_9ROSI|nr:hypothetical protein Dsin_033156 [Dipteronia sinensis]